MSGNGNQRSEVMTLSAFDNQDDSMLEAIHSMSTESEHIAAFDYLQDCVSSLESKDSGINLSPGSPGTSDSDLRLDPLGDDYKDHDLSNLEGISFVKMENTFLHSEDSLGDEDTNVKLENHEGGTGNGFSSLDHDYLNSEINMEDSKSMEGHEAGDSNDFKPGNLLGNFKNLIGGSENFVESTSNKELVVICGKGFSFESVRDRSTDTDVQGAKLDFKMFDIDNKYADSSSEQDSDFERSSDTEEQVWGDDSEVKNSTVGKADTLMQTCKQCPMTFKYKRHLDRHLEGHQKNNCTHCDAKFARKKHLDVHLFRSHGERVARNNNNSHTCDVCLRRFPKQLLLNRHKANHHNEKGKVCTDCGDVLLTAADIKEHTERHIKERRFKCDRCPQAFSMKQKYLVHVQNHDTYKCPKCEASFASKKRCNEHYRTTHSAKPKDPETPSKGSYNCVVCNKHNFMKRDSYLRHLRTAAHLNKMNTELPLKALFNCPKCSKQFSSRPALDQHIRRIHKEGKRFACGTQGCEFQSTNRSDLDRHKQLHVEERNIVCEHCGKTFTSVNILKDHVLYVHNKERQFVCEECGKAFKRNSLLKRHQMSHQQIRPFACQQCEAAFKRSHHLSRHMESCHRITLKKKKKVMKLMKTEDGQLVPVPEEPKTPKARKTKMKRYSEPVGMTVYQSTVRNLNDTLDIKDLTPIELPRDLSAISIPDAPEVPMELTSSLSEVSSIPQVLSLVDVNSGQVVTVEVTNPDTLPLTDLVDQFEANCSEMLGLTGFQDLGFQTEILNTDHSYYDQVSYAELPLEAVGDPLLLDLNSSKMDTLPAIENYLAQPFPPFLNL